LRAVYLWCKIGHLALNFLNMKLEIELKGRPQGFTGLDSQEVRAVRTLVGLYLSADNKPEYSIDGGKLILKIKEIAQATRAEVIGALKTTFSEEIEVKDMGD
jgi:hypothetical protein